MKRHRLWWQRLYYQGTLLRIECAICHMTPYDRLSFFVINGPSISMNDPNHFLPSAGEPERISVPLRILESHEVDGVRVIDKAEFVQERPMPPRIEDKSQQEVLLLMKAAIDTAIQRPGADTASTALSLAQRYPHAMAGGKMRTSLGQERWDWLTAHGFYPVKVVEPDFTT